MRMKRAVICMPDPENYIDQLDDYSIMIINPAAPESRQNYLLDNSDWSLKIDSQGWHTRNGSDHGHERLFWYTSGTTGDSKFCSFNQSQLDNLAARICQDYEITPNDRYVSVMPLWHAHGQGFYWASRVAGCETHFLSISKIRHLPTFAPTFVTAVPDVLKAVSQLNFDNLRFIRSASAALPDSLYQHLAQKHGCPILEAFGMTEALSHCFTNPLHGPQRMGTIGLPSGIQACIQDDQLRIRGSSVCSADWLDTGDLATQDELGYYKITGRLRDQINVKGYKLDPASIEKQLLHKIPSLESCVIFGHSEVMCLYAGQVEKKQIQEALLGIHTACRARLIEQVDSIPVSDSGKISRTWLSKIYK
jgi:acyl-coenzyme A synthetase/AMP-(fatty) acid ligase